MHSLQITCLRWATSVGAVLSTSLSHAALEPVELGIVAHPRSVITEVGKPATLAIILKGPVKSVQWRRNGKLIDNDNQLSLQTAPTEIKFKPDEYDVLVQDAFGKVEFSNIALVEGVEPDDKRLEIESRKLQSLKLQSLFDVVNLLDQADYRITNPLLDWRDRSASAANYHPGCTDRAKVNLIKLESTDLVNHEALRIEMNSCFIPRSNRMGHETGAVVSGLLVKSKKNTAMREKNLIVVEKMAKNLILNFPYSGTRQSDLEPVDFDIKINGTMTHIVDSRRPRDHTQIIRQEYFWSKGAQIENPQTKVKVEFISGKLVKESFGTVKRSTFDVSRETELFDKLKFKVGRDEILIDGMITRIIDQNQTHRSGQFNVLLNGKHIVSTASAMSPLSEIKGLLPDTPKLNGFFVNDHQRTAKELNTKAGVSH